MFYVYILRSRKDGKWYTGATRDLRKRFDEHNQGKVFSTKGRGPFKLLYYEACLDEGDALAREKYLKSGLGKTYLKNRLKRFLSLTGFNSTKEKGFTLIELLVVIGITAVLISMALGYSRESTRQLALTGTQAKMLSLMNRAKFLSIETFFGGGRSGDQRICAYGVKVDTSRQEMFIFQDLSGTGNCPGDSDGSYNENKNERLTGELNEVKLENTLAAFEETDLSEVIFIPPDPKTKINNSNATEAKVGVKIREGKGQFTITVNNAGQIKAE